MLLERELDPLENDFELEKPPQPGFAMTGVATIRAAIKAIVNFLNIIKYPYSLGRRVAR
jgi:hypothetical protein